MALTLRKGSKESVLELEDLQRYPSSLLTSLASSISCEDVPASYNVNEVADNPLASWEEALDITTALYRNKPKALLTTMSNLLQTESTTEVYSKLKSLVEYLGLPGSVHELLPPHSMFTIQHVPQAQAVLDLCYHALAHEAVDVMISSTGTLAWKANAAFFLLTAPKGDPQSLTVYSVSGGKLGSRSCAPANWLFKATDTKFRLDIGCMDYGPWPLAGLRVKMLSGKSRGDVISFWDACAADASDGSVDCSGISDTHQCFGRHIATVLKAALSSITFASPLSGASKTAADAHARSTVGAVCMTAEYKAYYQSSYTSNAHVWALHW